MGAEPEQVSLRVRLTTLAWGQLKRRAAARALALDHYSDMVFRYLLLENAPRQRPIANLDEEEPIYFNVQVPSGTKELLSAQSQREQLALASFCGLLLDSFLSRFEHDPRDLAMLHYVSGRLDEASVLSHSDLRHAIGRCERKGGVRLPPGYMAKWLHTRLKPIIGSVQHEGGTRELGVEVIEQILEDLPA